MGLYTVEVAGLPVATMKADTIEEAEEFFTGPAFKQDISTYEIKTNPGQPIWDGEAEIHVREALPKEAAVWERSHAKAIRDGEADPADDDWLTLLAPIREL